MTEKGWLTCYDPLTMLCCLVPSMERERQHRFIAGPIGTISDRKLRLFCCACCLIRGTDTKTVDDYEKNGPPDLEDEDDHKYTDLMWAKGWTERGSGPPFYSERADILRDIVGNPFRPVKMPPAEYLRFDGIEIRSTPILSRGLWQTPQVLAIAQTAYDSRDFSGLPVLADALEDAGCSDENVLEHLRGTECELCCGVGKRGYCKYCRGTYRMPHNGDGCYCPPCAVVISVRHLLEIQPCPDCKGSGIVHPPHNRGCFVLDLILRLE